MRKKREEFVEHTIESILTRSLSFSKQFACACLTFFRVSCLIELMLKNKKTRLFNLALLFLIAATIPLGVFFAQKSNDIRQRATTNAIQVSQSWLTSSHASSPGYSVISADTHDSGSVLVDSRFGLDGECNADRNLHIPWTQSWGHGNDFPNQSEFECKSRDAKVFYTVAKLDNDENYTKNTASILGSYLPSSPNYRESLQREAYAIFEKYIASGLKLDNAHNSFKLLPYFTANEKGAVYKVANEPDWAQGPYIAPDDYAILFHAYATQIKLLDPTAKIMIGGLIGSINNPGDWMCHDGHAPQPEINCTGSLGNRYNWIRVFRESYKTKYGSYPPVDIWGIHPYTWLDRWQQDPDTAWTDARDKIEQFKQFLDSIGEGKKDVWITEFSLGFPPGLINQDKEAETQQVADKYMWPLVSWLKTTTYVKRWFWFTADPSADGKSFNTVSNILKLDNGQYNALGKTYIKLMKLPPFSQEDQQQFAKLSANLRLFLTQNNNLSENISVIIQATTDISNQLKTLGVTARSVIGNGTVITVDAPVVKLLDIAAISEVTAVDLEVKNTLSSCSKGLRDLFSVDSGCPDNQAKNAQYRCSNDQASTALPTQTSCTWVQQLQQQADAACKTQSKSTIEVLPVDSGCPDNQAKAVYFRCTNGGETQFFNLGDKNSTAPSACHWIQQWQTDAESYCKTQVNCPQ